MDDGDSMTMMMQMTYYWGTDVTVLFDFWNTGGDTFYYVITLAALFFFAIIGEALSTLSARMRAKSKRIIARATREKGKKSPVATIVGTPQENLMYLVGSSFYLVKLILGYQLMLAVMTFNYGVSIAIFSGAFLGNFLFVRFVDTTGSNEEEYLQVDEIACHT